MPTDLTLLKVPGEVYERLEASAERHRRSLNSEAIVWLVAIDAHRYSVPFRLSGQTVEVVREGGCVVIRDQGQAVASHPVLAGRAQLSVRPRAWPRCGCAQAAPSLQLA